MDGMTPEGIQSTVASQSFNELSKSSEAIAANTGKIEGLTEKAESLQETFNKLYSELGDFQKELLNRLTQGDQELKAAQEAAAEIISDNFSNVNKDIDEGIKSKKKPTDTDVMKLSGKYSLGPLLVFSELRAIHNDLLKMFPNANKKQKPKELETSTDKPSKFLPLDGIKNVAAALKSFVIGTIMLKLIKPSIIEGGIKSIQFFLDEWNKMANSYKGSTIQRWKDLTEVIDEMGSAIKKLVIAVPLMAFLLPFLIISIPAFALLGVIMKTVSLLAGKSKLAKLGMKEFGGASIQMAASFAIFAAVLFFLGKFVWPYLGKALIGIGAICLIINETAQLGKVSKAQAANLKQFAVSSTILGAGYLIFGVSLKLLSTLGLGIIPALIGLATIEAVILTTIKFGKITKANAANFKTFALGAVLLGSAYLAFGFTFKILSGIGLLGYAKSLIGLSIISALIFRTLQLAKTIKQDMKDFSVFAAGAAILGIAYMAFGGAIKILSEVGFAALLAIPGLFIIAAVLYGTEVMAQEIDSCKKDFLMFAAGAVIIGVAYMVFGGALKIIGDVANNAPLALLGIALIAGVLIGTIAISKIVQTSMKDFLMFTAGCVVLAIAYMAFGGALKILSSFTISQLLMSIATIGFIIAIMGLSALLGYVIVQTGLIALIAIFAVAAGLLGGALAIFGGALLLLEKVGEADKSSITNALEIMMFVMIGLAKLVIPSFLALLALPSLVGVSLLLPVTIGLLLPSIKGIAELGQDFSASDINNGLGILTSVISGFAKIHGKEASKNIASLFPSSFLLKKTVENLVEPLSTITSLKDNIGESFEETIDLFTGKNMVTFISSMAQLSFGVRVFSASLSGLSNINKFKVFVTSLNSLVSAEGAIDKLLQFADKADSFRDIASSFERMATAFDAIASKDRKIKSIFDTLSKVDTHFEAMEVSTQQSIGGTTFDPAVTDIYNIMARWDKDGVPMRATLNEETLEITPDNIHNRTGAIKTRK